MVEGSRSYGSIRFGSRVRLCEEIGYVYVELELFVGLEGRAACWCALIAYKAEGADWQALCLYQGVCSCLRWS